MPTWTITQYLHQSFKQTIAHVCMDRGRVHPSYWTSFSFSCWGIWRLSSVAYFLRTLGVRVIDSGCLESSNGWHEAYTEEDGHRMWSTHVVLFTTILRTPSVAGPSPVWQWFRRTQLPLFQYLSQPNHLPCLRPKQPLLNCHLLLLRFYKCVSLSIREIPVSVVTSICLRKSTSLCFKRIHASSPADGRFHDTTSKLSVCNCEAEIRW